MNEIMDKIFDLADELKKLTGELDVELRDLQKEIDILSSDIK